jgi:hypothetical protein
LKALVGAAWLFRLLLRLFFLPSFRQCRAEIHVGQEASFGELTGLPAICDRLIVAPEKAPSLTQ